jgi:tetratricopeptide (TPR) repeat protein
MVLRSGTERRHVVNMSVFERTWARGKYWAMVALPPDRLPATAQEFSFVKSVAALEALGNFRAARTGYRTTVKEWPGSLIGWMGLGNSTFTLGDTSAAEDAFRQALTISPDYPPALNNIADLLARRGEFVEAKTLAMRALINDKGRSPVYKQTLEEIRARFPSK